MRPLGEVTRRPRIAAVLEQYPNRATYLCKSWTPVSSDCEATVIRVLGPFEDNEERAEWISRCPDDGTITLIKLDIDANGKPYLDFNE